LNWTTNSWTAGWSSRFFGAYRVAQIHRLAQGGDEVAAQWFHDVYLAYTFHADGAGRRRLGSLAGLTLQIGAKNIFDTAPAFDASNQTTFHSYYGDLRLGRYYLTVRKKF
jgi:outer membrane receptor protein involved in Fe transport